MVGSGDKRSISSHSTEVNSSSSKASSSGTVNKLLQLTREKLNKKSKKEQLGLINIFNVLGCSNSFDTEGQFEFITHLSLGNFDGHIPFTHHLKNHVFD